MKKIFEEAILEVITFETDDIVTLSTEMHIYNGSKHEYQKSIVDKFGSDKSWSDK